jgi:hypothetical protein
LENRHVNATGTFVTLVIQFFHPELSGDSSHFLQFCLVIKVTKELCERTKPLNSPHINPSRKKKEKRSDFR